MPQAFTYKTGDRIKCDVLIVDGKDASNPVVSIGGFHIAVPQLNLDKADDRLHGREQTAEERDLIEIRSRQDADAVARAEREKAADDAKTDEDDKTDPA